MAQVFIARNMVNKSETFYQELLLTSLEISVDRPWLIRYCYFKIQEALLSLIHELKEVASLSGLVNSGYMER